MSYCVNCAVEFDDNKKFCKFCGGKLQQQNPPKVEPSRLVRPEVQPIAPKTKPGDHYSLLSQWRVLLTIIIVSVLVFLGGYWGFARFTEDKNKPSETTKDSATPISEISKQQKTDTGLTKSPEEEVNQVIATLKKANLTKNIDLFLSCYSPDFSSLKDKKSATLASWKQYDYKTINYSIHNQGFYKGNAVGIVAWSITAYSHRTGNLISTDMAFNVVMHKENGRFKIISLEKLQ